MVFIFDGIARNCWRGGVSHGDRYIHYLYMFYVKIYKLYINCDGLEWILKCKRFPKGKTYNYYNSNGNLKLPI